YIELGAELQKRPLSRVEIAAMDLFDRIIHQKEIRLDVMLAPGDLLLANNYAVMHSRTSFEDFDELEKRRKLVRLWVKMPNARALAPDFPGQNGFPPSDSLLTNSS
ncbi:MAG: TauD/TfdA family dioxygenase, partial [Leucothrix sp.]